MPAYRRIQELREALSAPSGHLLPARRKQRAEEGILDVLNAVQQKFWPFDSWTQDCIAKALTSLKEAQYDDAILQARLALVPVEERDASREFPTRNRPVDVFKAELATLRTRSVR